MQSTKLCLCCGKDKPTLSGFAPRGSLGARADICLVCEDLPVRDAVRMALETAENISRWQRGTAAGRKASKRARLEAEYLAQGKRCTSCHAHKLPSDFDRCETRTDGLQASCRECQRIQRTLTSSPGGAQAWVAYRDTRRAQSAALQTGNQSAS